MENNKSPGLDGLSTNFYNNFWPILGHELTSVYNYAFDHGQLPLTQKRGIIALLFKKGDRTKLQNWRPITLLNTDYKILTKALANRLKHTLPLLVHTDQTACIPGRTINDNIRLIQDAITYANETDTPLALISVDQLKAFDRVSHEFLFKTLQKFNFGPQFQRWIRLLYTDEAQPRSQGFSPPRRGRAGKDARVFSRPSSPRRRKALRTRLGRGQLSEGQRLADCFYPITTWTPTRLCPVHASLRSDSRDLCDTYSQLPQHYWTPTSGLTTNDLTIC